MPTKANSGIVYLAVACYTVIIGFAFLFIKLALETAHPIDALAHRFTLALAAIAAVFLIARRRPHIDKKALLSMLPLVLFYPFLFFTLQTYGLVYTTSGEAGIINAAVPISTMVLASIFLKERSNWLQKGFTLLTVAGVAFIFLMKGTHFQASGMRGIALILLSALSLSAYSILARKLTQRHHYLDMTFLIMLAGFVAFNAMSVARHAAEGTLPHYFDAFRTPTFVWAALYLGVLSSMGTSLLTNFVLTRMEASRMSIFNNAATVLTILAGVVFLNEPLAYYHVIGALMVLAGVIGVGWAGRRKKASAAVRDPGGGRSVRQRQPMSWR